MKGSNSVILNPPVYVLMHLNNKNIIYNYNILTSFNLHNYVWIWSFLDQSEMFLERVSCILLKEKCVENEE